MDMGWGETGLPADFDPLGSFTPYDPNFDVLGILEQLATVGSPQLSVGSLWEGHDDDPNSLLLSFSGTLTTSWAYELGPVVDHTMGAALAAGGVLQHPASAALVPLPVSPPQLSQQGLLSGLLQVQEPAAALQMVVPDALQGGSVQPGMCFSCSSLLQLGAQLSVEIKAAGSVVSPELRSRTAFLTLKAGSCCSSRREPGGKPCLLASMEQLADGSLGRCWGIAESKARSAEQGRKRQRNGAPAFNFNFYSNSPHLLTGQQELLQFVADNSSSNTAISSSTSVAATGQLYSVRSTDGPKVAFAVALHHTVAAATAATGSHTLTAAPASIAAPAAGAGRAGVQLVGSPSSASSDLWCNTLHCNKKSHRLLGQTLPLFRYVCVVYNSDKPVTAKRLKGS